MMEDKITGTPKGGRPIVRIAVLGAILYTLFYFAQSVFAQTAAEKSERDRYISTIQNVFSFIQENYVDPVEAKKLYEGAMKGLLEALGDPYSAFLDESGMSMLSDLSTGSYSGVGMYISKQAPKPGTSGATPLFIEVVSPIEDTPAWKAGMQPGDLIIKINGESTDELSVDAAASKLKGPSGTEVEILVRRGGALEFTLKITRATVIIPSVKKAMLPGGIAYLRIIEFGGQTLTKVKEAFDYFKANSYSSLIVDVRSNPGGLLASVIEIADLFLEDGSIVSTKGRNNADESVSLAAAGAMVPRGMPVIVLINKGSASASEILAGALKDRKIALLLGETSYGKGSVQQWYNLGRDSGFKLTIARYYTPSGSSIDKRGIPPDIAVAEPTLDDEGYAHLSRLIESNAIQEFVANHPYPTQGEIKSFVEGLRKGGVKLEERLLKKLVRDELNRKTIAPVYDLDYDIQLAEAVAILSQGRFASLLSESKTLKELELEAAERDKVAASTKPSSSLPVPKLP